MQHADLQTLEAQRVARQAALDAERTASQRNKMGQFATPTALARDVMQFALALHTSSQPIHFHEPSCGTGAFFSALLHELPAAQRETLTATGTEIDEQFAAAAAELWGSHGFNVTCANFLNSDTTPPRAASLLVANPPYVRHHHIPADLKPQLAARCATQTGLRPSGLAGLYVYFMLLSHKLLAPDAVSAWLIPSEFLDTNYGAALRGYLRNNVTVNRVHRYDPEGTQFADATVTSCLVVFTNTQPRQNGSNLVEFSEGGTVNEPAAMKQVTQNALRPSHRWSPIFAPAMAARGRPLGDYMTVKRGIATGSNAFFILPRNRVESLGISRDNVTPIFPSPRHLRTDVVAGTVSGYPNIDTQLAVITTSAPLERLAVDDPPLADYLSKVDAKTRSSYLVSKRSPWYKVERRAPAPFLLSYMGRGKDGDDRPFNFILNRSDAIATNMYLMLYPREELAAKIHAAGIEIAAIHEALQAITARTLRAAGRVYGGGLRKIEPRELASLDAAALSEILDAADHSPCPRRDTPAANGEAGQFRR